MTADGIEYRGTDIFDSNDPINIYERNILKVWIRDQPAGFRIASFEVNVLETSSKQPSPYHEQGLTRLWLACVRKQGFFILQKCEGKRLGLGTKMVAVAKIDEHKLFREALFRVHGLRRVMLYLEQLDDKCLKFSAFLPAQLKGDDLDRFIITTPSRVIGAHELTFLLRMFNLIDDRNFYCSTHNHDRSGSCMPATRKIEEPQTSQTIQEFFDEIHNEKPSLKQYELRTEKLTARLRPYQRDAVRFMIDREQCPNLRFHCSWFYYHIKMETDTTPLYYIPNMAFFFTRKPVPPKLSACGGILADEMGLGKTVELLTLITTLTPDNTPEVLEQRGEIDEEDDVKEVLDDLISNVVAAVEGEKAVVQFKKSRSDTNVLFYNKTFTAPSSPTKNPTIKCEECGTSCVQQRVHWSPGLSVQTRFVCPECIMSTKELIPLKTTLIVVPDAIAHQWYEEIRKHVREDVKIDVYKGVTIDGYKHPHYLNQFDIVITTYDVITREKSFLTIHNPHERLRKRPYEACKMTCTPLFSVLWWRVCLDESQMVERCSSMVSKLCKSLQARARWSITGTPISSTIKDLYGLVNFLDIHPLDQEWFFDQCLYLYYSMNINRRHLVSFIARIMWRTEKKHLESLATRVTSHEETVTLSPMEERMYSDLLASSKEKVLGVVRNIAPDTKLGNLSSGTHSKLMIALSKVQLFLLTSLSGVRSLKKEIGDGSYAFDESQAGHFNRMFTPTSLFCRLLKEKKNVVNRAQRDVIMHLNGISALLWHTGKHDQAYIYYTKAVDFFLRTGHLNEFVGHSLAVIFTSRDSNEEKEEDIEKDGRVGKPLPCDSLQFVHLYRNVQWLLAARPDLMEKNNINMRVITLLFHQAWRTYSRNEVSMYKEKECEWDTVKKEMKKNYANASKLENWLDALTSGVDNVMGSEGQEFDHLQLNVERRVNMKFSCLRVMGGWIKNQLQIIHTTSNGLIQLIDRCIDVSNMDDLEDVVDEGRYRMTDRPSIVKSPKKNQEDARTGTNSKDSELQVMKGRQRGLTKRVVEVKTTSTGEKCQVDLLKILERETKDLFDGCLLCMSDGEFDESSQESCIFCATQSMHKRMQLENNIGSHSRSRASTLDAIVNELILVMKRQKEAKDEEDEKWKDLKTNWKEMIAAFDALDSFWRSLLIVMLEKMNRVRELRQCTIRSEADEKLVEEERKLQKAEAVLEKGIHNLKYVYSLREESGMGGASSSSISTDPSTRECPICFDEIGENWFVFPCAHLTCGRCFKRLVKLQGATRISCSVCRSVFSQVSVMYVSNKKKNSHCFVDSLNLSVKLDKIVRLAVSIMSESHNEKILVFTSLTLGLAALKSVFIRANFPFVVLETDHQKNAASLSKFRNNPEIRILLMRYEAGGKGLNLTVANHIIFADTVDDMSLEKQAIGRCDRIGQKRDVLLHYVVAKDTMDERMHKLTRESISTAYIQDDNWTVATLIDLFTEV